MKGIVFTEFLEMVEEKFSYEMVDDILTMKELPSKGIYSTVGTYSHTEIVTLVVNLHEKTEIPLPVLLETFGEYLFHSLFKAYGSMFTEIGNAFDMLESIEGYIHVQVRKLYPDAELPHFKIERVGDDKLILDYSSERSMGDLALGLIKGCLNHFKEEAEVKMEPLTDDGSKVRFIVSK